MKRQSLIGMFIEKATSRNERNRRSERVRSRALRLESLESRELLSVSPGGELLAIGASYASSDVSAPIVSEVNQETPSTIVTTNLDVVDPYDELVSLREALSYAETGATITFDDSLKGKTIALEHGELTTGKTLTIDASSLFDAANSAPGLTISGRDASRILYLNRDASVQMIGLALTNGYSNDSGGAFYLVARSTLTLVNCSATNNAAAYDGGAAYVATNSIFEATNTLFAGNSAQYGGAVEIFGGTATFYNCTVTGNSARNQGGGVNLDGTPKTAVLEAYNTIIADNAATEADADVCLYQSVVNVSANNTLSSFIDWKSGANNRAYSASQPLFTNAAAGDYTLAEGSQAIDRGEDQYVTTNVDLAGKPRVSGDAVDLGAYEYQIAGESNALDAPTVFCSAAPTTITVSWDAVPNAVGYDVSYKLASETEWSDDVAVGANLEFTIVGLEPNAEYDVRVQAVGDGVNFTDSEYSTTSVMTLDSLPNLEAPSTVVTTNLDLVDPYDELISLREAFGYAHPGDTITFDDSLKGQTIALEHDELTTSKTLTIDATSLFDATTAAPGLTISGQDASRILYLNRDADVVVKGIALTNGRSTVSGGAIYVASRAALSLENCSVTNSVAKNYGGAAYVATNSVFSATNTLLVGNTAQYGGAVEVFGGTATLYNCTVTDNTARNKGGGLNLDGTAKTVVFNAYNTIIAGNAASTGGDDVYRYNNSVDDSARNTLSSFADWTDGADNLIYDESQPLFKDAANGDYTLARDSQAIAKGDVQYVTTEFDLAGKPRVSDEAVDLGAYEYYAPEPIALDAPTLSYAATPTTITLSWDAVENAFGYGVSYKLADAEDWSDEIDAGTNLSVTISGLEPNTEYAVRVRALGDGVEFLDSEYSTTSVATPEPETLTAPTGLRETGKTDATISVAWDAVENAFGYGVSYKLADATDWSDDVDAGLNLAYTIDGLDANAEYEIRVRALGDGAEYLDSEYSTLSVTTLETPSTVVTTNIDVVDPYDGLISLREALDYAQSGDTITFDEALQGKTIALELGELTTSKTLTIDATNSAPGLTITGQDASRILNLAENADVEIDGITMTNGFSDGRGGAIYVSSASLSLIDCAVINSASENNGGAVCVATEPDAAEGNFTATNTLFAGNVAQSGGAFEVYGATATLYNCTVAGNTASRNGGGFDLVGTATLSAYNSIIAGNSAELDGADVYVNDSAYMDAAVVAQANNTLSSYADWADGANNLTYDASQPLFNDAENGDYTLAKDSQAIGKGDNQYVTTDVDLAGNPRVADETVDLGAYEYQITRETPSTVVTTNLDVVDPYDELISLREALDYAQSGDTITFDEALQGKTIALELGELTTSKTLTIDATNSAPGLTITGQDASRILNLAENADVEIDGITMTNGFSDGRGGAIYVSSASLSLIDCAVINSASENNGGAVCVATEPDAAEGNFTATNTLFAGNVAQSGGAFEVYGATATLYNCTVAGNTASRNGGGFDLVGTATLSAYNSIIAGNSAELDGADVYVNDSAYMDAAVVAQANNTLSSYADWADGANNLTYDASQPLFNDAENGDYTLADDSQAINKGDNQYVTTEFDLAGNPRVVGETVDLGAYECQKIRLDRPVVVLADKTETTITVSWDAVPNAERYSAAYRLAGETEWNRFNVGTELSHTFADLEENTEYEIQIKAVADGIDYKGIYSLILRVQTDATAVEPTRLDRPVATLEGKTTSTVTVSWDAVPNAERYSAAYRLAGETEWNRFNVGTELSHTFADLEENTEYEIQIKAVADGIDYKGIYSLILRVKTNPVVQLDAPVPSVEAKTATSITATWDAVPNATGYSFLWKNQDDASYSVVLLDAATTSHTMEELDNDATYAWKVLALGDGDGYLDSEYCATQSGKPRQRLATPILTVDAASTSLTISWTAVPNVERYSVGYKLASETEWNRFNAESNLSYTFDGLEEDAEYDLQVKAIGDGINYKSVYTEAVRAKTDATTSATLDLSDDLFDELAEEDYDLLAENFIA